MRRIFIVALLAACTDPKTPPLCSDVGCPVGSPALCTRAGACTCDGVACRRDSVDAGASAGADDNSPRSDAATLASGAVTDDAVVDDHD